MHPFPKSEQAPSAKQLNSDCRCSSLNRQALRSELNRLGGNDDLYRMIAEERPNLFAESAVFIDQSCLDQQLEIVAALERVIALPAYQQHVLQYAPEAAQFLAKAQGVFLGFDFHLSVDGPKLIEINSNAGGAMINALLIRAQNYCCDIVGNQQPGKLKSGGEAKDQTETAFMDMFYREWRSEHDLAPLRSIAIVDDEPHKQYMWPEFLLFKHLFEQHKIQTLICDPRALSYGDNRLWHGDVQIDLVYNRLTDFGLESPDCQALREAYLAGAVVLTPHPRNHALYADKRNLVWLGNDGFLKAIGVDDYTRTILCEGIAHTVLVDPEQAEWFWIERKQLFFKPAKGYGSKAAYRGDKLTRRVFESILEHDYVAQTLVKPSERHLEAGELKLDLRHYVYQGETQLVCARLYQGQTTNFRTPGGGFAQVVVVPDHYP